MQSCPFCDIENSDFAENEHLLDEHYVESCLMLTECRNCKKVIETKKYSEHMIGECSERHMVEECEDCGIVYD